MRASFLNGYKRSYYMRELMALGVTKVDGKTLHELSDRELKYALTIRKAVGS